MRSEIVTLARAWIGTPYRHQMSRQGVGVDCLGLVLGVWDSLFGTQPEQIAPYHLNAPDLPGRLMAGLERHFTRRGICEAQTGDVLVFDLRSSCQMRHLAIATSDQSFVHAYSRHGVVESAFSAPWRRRLVTTFAFPQGEF